MNRRANSDTGMISIFPWSSLAHRKRLMSTSLLTLSISFGRVSPVAVTRASMVRLMNGTLQTIVRITGSTDIRLSEFSSLHPYGDFLQNTLVVSPRILVVGVPRIRLVGNRWTRNE